MAGRCSTARSIPATPLPEAMKIAFLSFDASIRSNLAVARPLDLMVMPAAPGARSPDPPGRRRRSLFQRSLGALGRSAPRRRRDHPRSALHGGPRLSPFEALRRHGLAFPEAVEDFPWGHTALKVRGKTFAWLERGGGQAQPHRQAAGQPRLRRDLRFRRAGRLRPRPLGLDHCRFPPAQEPDLDLLKRWMAESYRAVAPKKLAALLPEEE